MRRLALALPLAMGLVCGAYTIIYLVRWEWNRAIIAGLFFVAVEVVFVAMVVVDRLRAMEARLDQLAGQPPTPAPAPADTAVLDAIADSGPPPRDHFGWLREQSRQTNVFLPVLLGAGVLASSLAWVVEHVARATLSPVRERRLAESLGVLRPPPDGFLGAPPVAHRRVHPLRRALVAVGAAAVLAAVTIGTAGAVDYVADRTQTRPDARMTGVETHIELELHGAVAAHDPERALGHLWSVCTGPDVFRLRQLPVPEVDQGPPGRFVIEVPTHVGEHEMDRLRGCLNDTTLDKVQGRVVRMEIASAG